MKHWCISLIALSLVSACAGKAPEPVQMGDEELTCRELVDGMREFSHKEQELRRTSRSHYRAMEQRYEHLRELYHEGGCQNQDYWLDPAVRSF